MTYSEAELDILGRCSTLQEATTELHRAGCQRTSKAIEIKWYRLRMPQASRFTPPPLMTVGMNALWRLNI